ncbi:MAG: GxxExxY protein [Patescibacteria group bacterium]
MKQGGGKVIYKELSYRIVGILYEVYNSLGYGYLEKHYEKAIEKCFIDYQIKYVRQAPYKIIFRKEVVGRNYMDFIVDNKIVLELKRGDHFSKSNIEQIKSYLAVTGMKLAILAHFTSKGVKIFRIFNPNNLKE